MLLMKAQFSSFMNYSFSISPVWSCMYRESERLVTHSLFKWKWKLSPLHLSQFAPVWYLLVLVQRRRCPLLLYAKRSYMASEIKCILKSRLLHFSQIVFNDTSSAHCSVRREALYQRSTEEAKIEAETKQCVSLYFNPLDILYLLTESVGQTLVICLEYRKIKRLWRDSSFTMIQPIFASPNAHIYFVSLAFASFSHDLLPFLIQYLAIYFKSEVSDSDAHVVELRLYLCAHIFCI